MAPRSSSAQPEVTLEKPRIARGDADSAAWWEALASGRLLLPRCSSCRRRWFPPAPTCPRCGAGSPTLEDATGLGRVYSWVVVHKAYDPAFAGEIPYVIVTVDLDEGARVVGRLVGARDALAADARVVAVPYGTSAGALLGFELR